MTIPYFQVMIDQSPLISMEGMSSSEMQIRDEILQMSNDESGYFSRTDGEAVIVYVKGDDFNYVKTLHWEDGQEISFDFEWSEAGGVEFLNKHSWICEKIANVSKGETPCHIMKVVDICMEMNTDETLQGTVYFPQSGIPVKLRVDLTTGMAKATINHLFVDMATLKQPAVYA